MTPNELTALLDRISQGTTTHDDAVRLAGWLIDGWDDNEMVDVIHDWLNIADGQYKTPRRVLDYIIANPAWGTSAAWYEHTND